MEKQTKLRNLRKRRKLSIRELARVTDVSEKVIRELEQGKRRADIKHVQVLADYFGISVDVMLSFCDGGDRG